jgi:hypothetical protein
LRSLASLSNRPAQNLNLQELNWSVATIKFSGTQIFSTAVWHFFSGQTVGKIRDKKAIRQRVDLGATPSIWIETC